LRTRWWTRCEGGSWHSFSMTVANHDRCKP
jgi:hypothetical protein